MPLDAESRVWKCGVCGLLFKDVCAVESAVVNRTAWKDLPNHMEETGATNPRLSRLYLKKLQSSLGLSGFTGLKVLDFGAGRGDMLAALSEAGARAYGVEPFGYAYLKEKSLEVFQSLDDIPAGMKFDGIIANDVIEHLMDPRRALRILLGLLSQGGWLYLSTPNSGGLHARLAGRRWREFRNKGHIRLFSARCIERSVMEPEGAEYRRLRWLVDYGGATAVIKIVRYLMQIFWADGALRYIVRKKDSGHV
jgi:2-polyprenyl-3-methyl-5-hydroxy-6-metoxy-1,4-benzoquinol methylase